MLEAGIYRARAVEATPSKASTGNEQVIVKFEVNEGGHHSIYWYATITPKTERRVIAGLLQCGWDGVSEDFKGITSQEVDIEIRTETDLKGVPVAKVFGVVVPGLGVQNELLGSDRANFFGRMKAKAAVLQDQLKSTTPRRSDDFPY
jgi:hypothetical protein